jgi:hypothetical protein
MKRPTKEITLQEYRALTAKCPRKMSGAREPPTGLTTMLKEGWAYIYDPRYGERLTKDGVDTGWCEDEKSVVQAARAAVRAARVGDSI